MIGEALLEYDIGQSLDYDNNLVTGQYGPSKCHTIKYILLVYEQTDSYLQ